MIPFDPIIITPFALFGVAKESFAGIKSGCGGLSPPSSHLILRGELFFSVALKSKVTDDDGGQPSGIYSGFHILINT